MKLQEVKKYLAKEKLDAIVLFNKDPNFNYFVGGDYEHGIMFLSKNGNYLFLSPLHNPKFNGFKVVHWNKFKEEFSLFIKKNRIKKVGVDNYQLYVRQKSFLKKYFKLTDASKFLIELRETKTKEEIIRIRTAARITDDLFSSLLKNFNFKTEADIVKFMKIKALEAGVEMSFEPIVASGKNAVTAHHNQNTTLNKGFMILDFGIKYRGYLSDMTRTIYLGKPSDKDIGLYRKVLRIQESCIAKAKVGMSAGKLYNYSIRMFGEDAKYFIHGLGHGVGVEIHERPSFGLKSKDVLQKNSVFTIEPGYYNPKTGIGIRIEDNILLGDKKEVLTKSTKNLVCMKLK
jgi:Xaa-Pro aminopeptidase